MTMFQIRRKRLDGSDCNRPERTAVCEVFYGTFADAYERVAEWDRKPEEAGYFHTATVLATMREDVRCSKLSVG